MSSEVILNGLLLDTTKTRDRETLWAIYTSPRKNRPPLHCRKHNSPMYLQMRSDGLWAIHWPGQGECGIRIGGEPETPAHRHLKDYSAQACDTAGFTVQIEHRLGYRQPQPDLYVQAPTLTFAVEAQNSALTTTDAKTRTTRLANAGAPPFWVPNYYGRWQDHVPTVRPITDIDWNHSPKARTVPVASLRRIEPGHCTPHGPFQRCPNQRPGKPSNCYDWHPHYVVRQGWLLDDALAAIGRHELVAHQNKRGDVHVVAPEDLAIYLELTGHDGAFNPGNGRAATPPAQPTSRQCAADRPIVYDIECSIPGCNQPLWHLRSQATGICAHCWKVLQPDQNPIQLTFKFGTA